MRALWPVRLPALDRNELRRPVDRIRVWGTVGAVALFLGLLPLVARPVMGGMWGSGIRTAQVQARHRHAVNAVLPRGANPTIAMEGVVPERVGALWAGPDGRLRRGHIDISERVRAGGTAGIWVDDRGRPVAPPLRTSQVRERAWLGGFGAAAGLALVVGVALVVLRWRLDRRAYAEWELEWAVMEPRWTRRN